MRKCKLMICFISICILLSNYDCVMASEIKEEQINSQSTEAVTGSSATVKKNDELIKELIKKMIEVENIQDWEKYPDFWCSSKKAEFIELFKSDYFIKNNLGISTVRTAELMDVSEVSEDEIPSEFKHSSDYKWCKEWKAYLVAVDYTVEEVNGYFYNGINYSLITLGKENNEWKIIGRSEVSLNLLESLASVYSLDSDIDNVSIALEIRHAREHGLLMDSNMVIYENISTDDDAISKYEKCKNSRAIIKQCEHVEYSTIRVQSYSSPIKFDDYIKVNLFSELIVSEKRDQAFMAQMVASKQMAMFIAYYEKKYLSEGYDIDLGTQAYRPDSYTPMYASYVDGLYDAIKHLHMESETGKAFKSHYAREWKDLEYIGEPGMVQDEITKMDASIPFSKILETYYKGITSNGVYVGNMQLVAYNNYSGWIKVDNTWYYYNSQTHYPFMGWKEINNLYYYFDSNAYGAMVTGWLKDGNTWYYLGKSTDNTTEGAMFASRWLEDPKGSGTWYYFDASGAMLAGVTREIDGIRYSFDNSGVCLNPYGN